MQGKAYLRHLNHGGMNIVGEAALNTEDDHHNDDDDDEDVHNDDDDDLDITLLLWRMRNGQQLLF